MTSWLAIPTSFAMLTALSFIASNWDSFIISAGLATFLRLAIAVSYSKTKSFKLLATLLIESANNSPAVKDIKLLVNSSPKLLKNPLFKFLFKSFISLLVWVIAWFIFLNSLDKLDKSILFVVSKLSPNWFIVFLNSSAFFTASSNKSVPSYFLSNSCKLLNALVLNSSNFLSAFSLFTSIPTSIWLLLTSIEFLFLDIEFWTFSITWS